MLRKQGVSDWGQSVSLGRRVMGEKSEDQGGLRRSGQAKGRVAARGTHRAHDAHDTLPKQSRVDVIGALAATLGKKDAGEG